MTSDRYKVTDLWQITIIDIIINVIDNFQVPYRMTNKVYLLIVVLLLKRLDNILNVSATMMITLRIIILVC